MLDACLCVPAGVCLDVLLDVVVVPGPPVSWTVSLSDYAPGAWREAAPSTPCTQAPP